MTASLKIKNGIFQMIFSYKDSTGKWKQKSESTGLKEKGNKRRAETMLKERLAELEKLSAMAVECSNLLFLDTMEEWLNDVMTFQVRTNTLDEYKRAFSYHIKPYPGFQGLKLSELTPRILQIYYNTKLKAGLSPNTLRKQHTNFNKFLRYARSLDMIENNPAERVTLPAKVKSHAAHFYTATQLQELICLFWGDEIETPVFLSATLGLRRSEACGLRWESIDFEARRIYICHTAIVSNGQIIYSDQTKSQSSLRCLPMGDALYEYLTQIKAGQEEMKSLCGSGYLTSDYVCVKQDGAPINPDFVTHHFQRVIKNSNLPLIRFHDLRHSAATLLHSSGFDLKDIQTWLGHSDIQTTSNIYTHQEDSRMVGMAQAIGDAIKPRLKAV